MTMLGHMSRLAAVGIHLAGIGIAMSMPGSPPPAPMREIPITLSMAPPEPPAPAVEEPPEPTPEPEPQPQPVVEEIPPPLPQPVLEPPPEVIASAETSVAAATVPPPEPPPPPPPPTPPPAPGSVKIIDAYNARLQSWVQRHHRYPGQARSKREQGTALVWFVIDRDGRLQNCKIQRSSGSAVLDDAALKTLRRSSPFPAAPEEIKDVVIERVIPVDFYIR